jgi:hypothetical protein
MKISELINELKKAEQLHGDVECLVEVMDYDVAYMLPVNELNFEEKEGYGRTIALLH